SEKSSTKRHRKPLAQCQGECTIIRYLKFLAAPNLWPRSAAAVTVHPVAAAFVDRARRSKPRSPFGPSRSHASAPQLTVNKLPSDYPDPLPPLAGRRCFVPVHRDTRRLPPHA